MNIYKPLKNNFPFIKSAARYFADKTVSNIIEEKFSEIKYKFEEWYLKLYQNIIITISSDIILLLMAVIPYLFFSINNVIILLISTISILLFVRFIYMTIKLIFDIIINWFYISVFFYSVVECKSLSTAIKRSLRVLFNVEYYKKTNKISRMLHKAGSYFGFIKSSEDMEDDVVDNFYPYVEKYVLKVVLSKIVLFSIYCIMYIFLLRPYVFSNTLKMTFFEVIFYPFTVALPAIIDIIKGLL